MKKLNARVLMVALVTLMSGLLPFQTEACDVSRECVQVQQAMEEFYASAIKSGDFDVSKSLNLGRGQNRVYFGREIIERFLRENRSQLEAVLSQGEAATKQATKLIAEFTANSNLPPSELHKMGAAIDEAIGKANKIATLVHSLEQGANGGLVGNGILWPDNVPKNMRHLNADALEVKAIDYRYLTGKMGLDVDKLARLAEYSGGVTEVTKTEINSLRSKAMRIPDSNSYEAKIAMQEATMIENGVFRSRFAPKTFARTIMGGAGRFFRIAR